jgi:hypothetical protein
MTSDERMVEMSKANYPNTIIIDTADIMRQYTEKVHGTIDRRDYGEIMAQLIQILLNCICEKLDAHDFPFPELERLRYTKLDDGSKELKQAVDACQWLLDAIINKLQTYKAFVDDDFPYFFDKFTGDDIVLQHLPY